MGLIREPEGVDFYVENTPPTEQEKNRISEIIAHYKRTGKKKRYVQQKLAGRRPKASGRNEAKEV